MWSDSKGNWNADDTVSLFEELTGMYYGNFGTTVISAAKCEIEYLLL